MANGVVYFGGEDNNAYAFAPAAGGPMVCATDGPFNTAPVISDGIVYFATLKQRTYGLDARTGHRVWAFPDGKYTPVVADRKRLYLIGRSAVYAFRGSK